MGNPDRGNRQQGQGMTEYIIIVALIAVGAIAMVGFFGDTIRAQFYNMTSALAGSSNKKDPGAIINRAKSEANKSKRMGDFQP
jgi:pilus assembly protein Flp/PilA